MAYRRQAPSNRLQPDQIVPRDVKKAIAYLRKNSDRPVAMADLIAVAGVARRTLNKHFQDFIGETPRGYLRRLRLERVHTRLAAAEGRASVTDIATAAGFTHFGRFSADYRKLYGEAPSQTLTRARASALDTVAVGVPPISGVRY